MKPKIVAIVGPTASGKTALGIEIAKRFSGEILSIDSRQIYRGMDIGTAKPKGEWKESVLIVENIPHYGIDLVNPDQHFSVADFKKYADEKISEILQRNHLPILVGGTGLWLQAIVDHFDFTGTSADPRLRQELETRSIEELFDEYKRLDPKGALVIDRFNKRRLVRALEVTKLTGKPFSEQQTRGESLYDVLQIGLKVDRGVLNERINHRVDEMITNGLVEEVRALKEKYVCAIESMTGIGYRQLCDFFEGHVTLETAIDDIKKETRHYAKRQMTWFKRDSRIVWIQEKNKAFSLVKQFLN